METAVLYNLICIIMYPLHRGECITIRWVLGDAYRSGRVNTH
jgi:hypothetical protein